MTPVYGIPMIPLFVPILAVAFVTLFVVLLIKRPMGALALLLAGAGVLLLGFFTVHISVPTAQMAATVQQNQSQAQQQVQVQLQMQRAHYIAALPPTTQGGKLWVNNLADFKDQSNWQGFRAESSDTCVNDAEARQDAISNAAHEVAQNVIARYPTLNFDQVQQHAMTMLWSGQMIDDQFVKTTPKPYGTLWKHYLLVDTSPQNLDAVAQQYQQVYVAHETHELTTWGSLGVLCAVIIGVYLFLNAATKGYFVWRLRAAALLVVIVAALVVTMYLA